VIFGKIRQAMRRLDGELLEDFHNLLRELRVAACFTRQPRSEMTPSIGCRRREEYHKAVAHMASLHFAGRG
jgi:hypothetical protein